MGGGDPTDRTIYDADTDILLVAGHIEQEAARRRVGRGSACSSRTPASARAWRTAIPVTSSKSGGSISLYPGDFAPLYDKNPGSPRAALWTVNGVMLVQFMESAGDHALRPRDGELHRSVLP